MTPDLEVIEARWEGARWDYWPVGYAPALEEAVRIAHATNDIHALLAAVRERDALLRESRRRHSDGTCCASQVGFWGLSGDCDCGADAWNREVALLGEETP